MESIALTESGQVGRISDAERRLVNLKLEELAEVERQFEKLEKKEKNAKSTIAANEILIERSLLTEQSTRILVELNEMKRSALRYYFGLTIAQIDKLSDDEQRQRFLTLMELSR